MSEIPGDLKFLKSHEWARVEDNGQVTVGISDHAQGLLGDLVYVELPGVGDTVTAGGAVAVVESVKAASDVYSPVSGKVVAVNEALADKPETINEDAYGEGWILVVQPDDMDADQRAAVAGRLRRADRGRRPLSGRSTCSAPAARAAGVLFRPQNLQERSPPMPFLPHTESDVQAMLKAIGADQHRPAVRRDSRRADHQVAGARCPRPRTRWKWCG